MSGRSTALSYALEHFPNARKNGTGWKDRCCCHEERTASLHISDGDKGVLFKCYGCGAGFDDVVKAKGLDPKRLFHEPLRRTEPRAERRRERELVATYSYHDADGQLRYQKQRWRYLDNGEKTFSFRRPDPDRRGAWLSRMGDTPHVLYRLPELLAGLAAGETAYLCEGEKDADRLAAQGLVATSNDDGAGKWRASYTETLKGASRVVLLEDNDEAGRKHTAVVGPQLLAAGIPVFVLRLPGLPEKGDVSDWLDAGHTLEQFLALAEAAPAWEGDPAEVEAARLPQIEVIEHVPTVAAQAWAALLAANEPPSHFLYAGGMARVERDEEGLPFIRPVTEDRLGYHLARCAQWTARNEKGELLPARPPLWAVKDLLSRPDKPLPVLSRLVAAPVLGPDGSIQTEPGYHPGSRTFYAPAEGFTVPPVSPRPTVAEVAHARGLLLDELLGDFPFVDQADRAHALSLALLLFVRALIPGPTPLHLLEKPTPGTGASLLVDVLLFLALGHSVPTMTEARDGDEMRKRITSRLRSGAQAINIDNLRRRLDSEALSAAITSVTWEDRILGQTETVRIPIQCAWVATGNNPALSNEMVRRTIRVRMDAKTDRPWMRTEFRHPDLRSWVQENRGRLVWAALTLASAWVAAGRPAFRGKPLGSFEAWSKVMGGILEVAGIPGFLENTEQFYEEADAEGASWRNFVLSWWETHGGDEVGVADLWAIATQCDPAIDLGDGGERSQRTRLGKALGFIRDRHFEFGTDGGPITLRVQAGKVLRRAQQWSLCEHRSASKPHVHTHVHTDSEAPSGTQTDPCVNVENVCERFSDPHAYADTHTNAGARAEEFPEVHTRSHVHTDEADPGDVADAELSSLFPQVFRRGDGALRPWEVGA